MSGCDDTVVRAPESAAIYRGRTDQGDNGVNVRLRLPEPGDETSSRYEVQCVLVKTGLKSQEGEWAVDRC